MKQEPKRTPKTHTKNKAVQLGLRIESWLKDQLDLIAERDERTVAQVVRQALKEYVSRNQAQSAA